MFQPVYLDHNATTPLDPAVLEAMLPWLRSRFGNASSRHEYGRAARQAIDEARQQVAAAVGAHPTEVVFTSGGTEANNLFLKGAAASLKPGLLAVSAIEHPCVRKPAPSWQAGLAGRDSRGRRGREGGFRRASLGVVAARPRLVSVMLANNETGVIQDVAALATAASDVGRLVPHRCGAGAGQDAGRFPGAERGRRSCHDPVGAQDRRPEGRGGAGARQARRTAAADRRRRA